ncbi:sulfate permease [Evansella sp. AB-P1]|uniref:SulP family inorganic anion transporter n=1 Tax=Evansella sp. AB-P1 TaxID=3037653 RepID=UPI0024201FEB|nr:sulfate permease [Evansella sp. AB-P1]MDG5787722.1 sulfate permease [Evansella sp. AB-P1]
MFKKDKYLLQNYNKTDLTHDVISGLTLFVMLIPQGMAYAMLAGLPPVMGLYASTIPLFIYAFFASSRHLSVGPVAITSLLVYSGVSVYASPRSEEFISLAITLALMVGVIQLLLGVFKVGFVTKFISHAVMSAYTSAAAIVIGLSQLKHFLGIDLGSYLHIHMLFYELFGKINELHLITLLVGAGSIILLITLKKLTPSIPPGLTVIIVSIISVYFFQLDQTGLQIVGNVPQGFPSLTLPSITIEAVQQLWPIALTIALLGFMESLAIGKAIADKENYCIHPNHEFKALGLANITASLVHALPINGSFSRSAVNYQTGGHTQLASVFTGMLVILTLLFFTSFFYYLPNAVLASIIIMAVYKLVNVKQVVHLFKIKPTDGWCWVVTFVSTLFIGMQWGILIGIILSLLFLLKRSSKPNVVELGYIEKENVFRDVKRFPQAKTVDEFMMIRIDASIHFANIGYLENKIAVFIQQKPAIKWVVLDMSGVNDIDTISIEVLEKIMNKYKKAKEITFLFCNMKGPVRETVKKSRLGRKV